MPGMIDFSPLLHHGEGLVGFALRSTDLEADATRLRAQLQNTGVSVTRDGDNIILNMPRIV